MALSFGSMFSGSGTSKGYNSDVFYPTGGNLPAYNYETIDGVEYGLPTSAPAPRNTSGYASPYSTPGVNWPGGSRTSNSPVANTANTDGGSDFFTKIARLGEGLLANAGVQSERREPAGVQRVAYDPNAATSVGGIDIKILGIAALVAGGIYLAYRN